MDLMSKSSSINVVIVIPTYNEKDNIARLIEFIQLKVANILPQKYFLQLLVVDDSSPDGTAKIVSKLSKKYDNVFLCLKKQKSGLGSAYIKGMLYAIKHLNADVLFEMDADFSHDPLEIPKFLKKIESGNDLVLGSRYIKGGSIPKNWGFHRKMLSFFGNLMIRVVLTNFSIHDWSTGYRALTKKLFNSIKKDMRGKKFAGYTFQIGFLQNTLKKGFKVCEVPIHFIDREYGKSKIGMEYIINTLIYIFTIRVIELKQKIKFGIVGSIGFIINFSAMEVFYRAFNISPDNAVIIGAELAIISNFTLNNLWTFKERRIKRSKKILGKFLQFNLASSGAIIIQKIVVWLGILSFGINFYRLYFIFAVGIGMFVNYYVYSRVIWKHDKPKM